MGQFVSFAEVLKQRILSEIPSENGQNLEETGGAKPHFSSENPFISSTDRKTGEARTNVFREETRGFAWILGHTPQMESLLKTGHSPRGKTAYGVKTRPRPPHKMTREQESAYCYFHSYIPDFTADFSRRELQKAFRLIAKKLHPDMGGNAQEFIALKAQLEVLATVFDRPTSCSL